MHFGRRGTGVIFGMALLGVAIPTVTPAQFAAPADAPSPSLQRQIDEWYRRASQLAPGTWGIAIARSDGQLIWGMNPTTPLIPASTVKIFTTGYARTMVGAEARRATRVVGHGDLDPNTGAWTGSWALELNGDFTFERPGKSGPSLAELASQLADQGIRRLSGPFHVVSESGQPDARYPSAWADRHRGRMFAPLVGQVTVNENSVSFRVAPSHVAGRAPAIVAESPMGLSFLITNRAQTVAGRASNLRLAGTASGGWVLSGTIGTQAGQRTLNAVSSNPRALLEAAWRHALQQAGIEWTPPDSAAEREPAPVRMVLAEVHSMPYDSVAVEVNSRSNNLGAELLLRWAAGEDPHRAAEELTRHVRQVTGDPLGVSLVDGSGLSDQDRASAWSFIAYLARAPYLPGGRNFASLLPANGQGTLRSLVTGFPGEGVVRAKTGTLANVASVSGYLGSRDGVLLVSIMYNGSRTAAARQEQWRLFRLLGADGTLIPTESDIFGGQLGGQVAPRGSITPARP